MLNDFIPNICTHEWDNLPFSRLLLTFLIHAEETTSEPLYELTPERAAHLFRGYFQLPQRLGYYAMARLFARLGYREVYLKEGLEEATRVRAMWSSVDVCAQPKLIVDAARPELSQVRSALHEIIEPVWVYSRARAGAPPPTVKDRERWATAFASMVTMPPDLVRLRASDEPAQIADAMNETLGASLRQLRDVSSAAGGRGGEAEGSLVRRRFYYARYELVDEEPAELPLSYQIASYRVEVTRGIPGVCILLVDLIICAGFDNSAADIANLPVEYTPHVRRYQLANPLWIHRLEALVHQRREPPGRNMRGEIGRRLAVSQLRCSLSGVSRRGLPYQFSVYAVGDKSARLRGFYVMCELSVSREHDCDETVALSYQEDWEQDWLVSYDKWEIAVDLPDDLGTPDGPETLWPGLLAH